MGWSHEEAKKHDITERLIERCANYAGSACPGVRPHDDWCERCLAAEEIERLRAEQ